MPNKHICNALVFALLAAIYFAAGKLGLSLAFVNVSASAVWPPSGIALAAFLLLGRRVWPAILVGAFLVNITTSGSIVASLVIAVGDTLEAATGAYFVDRFAGGKRAFERAHDAFKLAVLGGLLATTVGASVGTSALALSAQAAWSDYGPIWLTWWLGDASGVLIVAPVLILWATNPAIQWNRRRIAEAALLLLATVALSLTMFAGSHLLSTRNYPLEFLILPVLVWAAYRFGQRETATTAVIVASIAIAGTLHGLGPFARYAPNESLLLLQTFMGIVAVTGLILAALVAERKRAEESARWLATIVESSDDAIVGKMLDGTISSWNEAAERIYGYTAAEAIGRSATMLNPPDRKNEVAQLLQRIRRGERVHHYETERMRKDGRRISVSLTVSPIKDARGVIHGASAIARDISDRKRSEARIRHIAQHDPLTGLPNRVLLYDRIGRAIAQARRGRGIMAVLFLDLDNFKKINDSHGHQVGDRVLRMASRRLPRCLRDVDSIGRLGGDEFVVCLPGLSAADDATLVADKMLRALRRPFVVNRQRLHVSGSIGIGVYPGDGADTESLMRAADLAMYDAKASGRSNYHFFQPRKSGSR